MPRATNKLTTIGIAALKKPGRYPDGGGLYVQITRGKDGQLKKSWLLRIASLEEDPRTGKLKKRELGLGSLTKVDLATARKLAQAARELRATGKDPLEQRRATRHRPEAKTAKSITFKVAAERYLELRRLGWKNKVHRAQWDSSLRSYAFPVLGELDVAAIDVKLVLQVVEPLWTARKLETGRRVRARIASVLDWAIAHEFRGGPNPAAWRGLLDKILPAPRSLRQVVHHKAMPYAEVPGFFAELRKREGISSLALQWTILTGARTSETIGMIWSEIDVDGRLWTVPADRIKMKRIHKVPLTDAALSIIRPLRLDARPSDFVFPGQKDGAGLSNAAMLDLLQNTMGRTETVHGFRSSMRDFASERTDYGGEVAEASLAHAISSAVERAYRRTTLLDKRRRLAEIWADYCSSGIVMTTPGDANGQSDFDAGSRRH